MGSIGGREGRKRVIPAQVVGSRAGDDVRLRRRLIVAARTAAAAAAAVLAAGFLLVTPGAESVDASFQVAAASPTAPTPSASPAQPSPTGTVMSPVAWQVRRTGDRAKDAALAGYRDYVGTAVRLGEDPDPADPALAEVALDPELGRFRRALSVNSDAQVSRRGRVVVIAWVLSLRGSQAIVVGCANSAAQQWYDGSQRRAAWRGGITVTAARLQLRAGRWRVYLVSPMSPSRCRG
jgi:hypothetical protein